MVNIANDFIYFADYNGRLKELSILSPEKWDFDGKQDYGILKNYLQYTINKLIEEKRLLKKMEMLHLILDFLLNIMNQFIFI